MGEPARADDGADGGDDAIEFASSPKLPGATSRRNETVERNDVVAPRFFPHPICPTYRHSAAAASANPEAAEAMS